MAVPRRHYASCLCAGLLACLSEPPAADAPARVPVLSAIDARGLAVPLGALARRPRFTLVTPTPLAADSEAPWLLTGPSDAALLSDLTRLPLSAANRARIQPTRKLLRGHTAVIEPTQALAPGMTYTLALPRSAVPEAEEPWVMELQVAATPQAGAALYRTFPAHGTSGIAPAPLHAVLAFDGEVTGYEAGIWLADDAGQAWPGTASAVDCGAYESAAVSCILWHTDVPLAPAARYELRSGRALRDAHGAELPELHARFDTAADSGADALPQASVCALDQRALDSGCAWIGDDFVHITLPQTPARRLQLELADQRIALLPSVDGASVRFGGLAPEQAYTLRVARIDAAERASVSSFALRTSAPLPTLSIDKVYADARGPEPAQEFVEVLNYGEQPVPLAGLQLADSADDPGLPIASALTLPAHARAWLVAFTYDPASPLDPAPEPDVLLVRIGKTVTRAGLSNAGESLYLRDADGRRVSAAPATPKPRAGQCVVRVSADPRSAEPSSFDYAPDGACGPVEQPP